MVSAMCVGSFMEADDRKATLNVCKHGYSGTFAVKYILDDKKYYTGITITFP